MKELAMQGNGLEEEHIIPECWSTDERFAVQTMKYTFTRDQNKCLSEMSCWYVLEGTGYIRKMHCPKS